MSATLIMPSMNTQYFCIAWSDSNDPSIKIHEALRELSDSDFAAIQSLVRVVSNYFKDRELLASIEMNHDDYHKTLSQCEERCATREVASYFVQRRMFIDVNRRIGNFLSSVRTFLDHHQAELTRLGADGETRFINFKKIKARAFDGDFSYRFLSQLRNYVQHCGLPLGGFGYHANLCEDGSVESAIEIRFDRDALLSNFEWHRQVQPDLEAQVKHFDITPHIDRMMDWMNKIQNVLSNDLMSGLAEAVAAIEEFMSPALGRIGMPCICSQTFDEAVEGESSLKITHLPIEQIYLLKDEVLKGNPVSEGKPGRENPEGGCG